MFETDTRKRPYAEKSDQDVRLKKPYQKTNGKNLDTQLPGIRSHDRFIEQHGLNFISPTSCFTPQDPSNIPGNCVPQQDEALAGDISLFTMLEYKNFDEPILRTNPWSEDDIGSPNEDLLLKDTNMVARVCFGVVSCLSPFRSTSNNVISS
jgi:hypothetical protein